MKTKYHKYKKKTYKNRKNLNLKKNEVHGLFGKI